MTDKTQKSGAFAALSEPARKLAKAAYRASDTAKSDKPMTIDEWLATSDGKKAVADAKTEAK